MDITTAKALINEEHNSDNGLDLLFRMSANVETERIANFVVALKCLQEHYLNKTHIEKELAYQLFSMHQTLQASSRHWKVSRPKGLDKKTCFTIFDTIRNIFSN